jgi:uncharacterized membrane protein YbhN (UPF0104 family)
LAANYIYTHWPEFRALLTQPIGAKTWLKLILGLAATLVLNSELLRLGVKAQGAPLDFKEGLALNMSTMAANYFIPFKGGAGLRAYYLVARWRLPLTAFLSQLLAISVVSLITGSFLAFFGLLALEPSRAKGPLLAYFAGTFLLGGALLLWLGRLKWAKSHPRLGALIQGWDVFRANPKLLGRLLSLQTMYFIILAAVNSQCFAAFQVELSFNKALFFSAVQIHSTIINLTPAGLGVVEAFAVLAGQALGFSPAEALLAQGLNRVVQLALLLASGWWGWFYLKGLKRPIDS